MIGFRPTKPVITIGIVLNLAVLAIWVVSRTAGIAIGGDGTPEAWGRTDILCAVFEGLAVLASFALLSKSISRRPLSATVGFSARRLHRRRGRGARQLDLQPGRNREQRRERPERRRPQPRCGRRRQLPTVMTTPTR